jgi:NitT/TauT family transport system ATP-binding protein
MGAALLEVNGLSKVYRNGRNETTAIDRLDFAVAEREFCAVVGPSGCGKTTLLKCIAGLLRPTAGATVLGGRVIDAPPDDIAVIFQDYNRSLMPWLTVERNVTLPLRRDVPDRKQIAASSLAAVGLAGFTNHYPWQLSGGMQQRVAIARALAFRPKVLLMDEPFASVDAQTRGELEDLVLAVRAEFDITVLLVTHDIDEAVYMSDRVVVLTSPPTRVLEDFEIALARPRNQHDTKAQPAFAELRTQVYEAIVRGRSPHGEQSAPAEVS